MARDHRDPRRPHFWPGRRGQLLADGGDRALWTVLRDTRRYEGEGRGESDPQSRRLRTALRGREVARDLESRVYAVRSAGGRLAQAAPRAFRRHGGRPRASDVDDAARHSLEAGPRVYGRRGRSEEHTSELQSPYDIVCRLLLE